jgi:ribosomal protein S18 acetylase RimI-like enzyme
MSSTAKTLSNGATLSHATTPTELADCFSVMFELRQKLANSDEWVDRASAMAENGYRVLVASEGGKAVAVAGYRVTESLIHGRYLYVHDLVTSGKSRGKGLGAELLKELASIALAQGSNRLVLDTAATNTEARRFYQREGFLDGIVGFFKPLA